MIPGAGPPAAVKVLVAIKPVDFRKGMDGLARLVKEEMKADPFSGVVYVFRSRRADRMKILWWDGSGVVLYAKRLEQGAFRWPKIGDGAMRLTPSQLAALIEGMDWSRVLAPRRTPAPQVVGLTLRRGDSGRTRGRHKALRIWSNRLCGSTAGHGRQRDLEPAPGGAGPPCGRARNA